MSDELIAVSPDWAKRAWVDDAKYKEMYDAIAEHKITHLCGAPTVMLLPDRYLAANVAQQTDVEIITWPTGACEVHERFTGVQMRDLRRSFPDGLAVVAHPECPTDVTAEADFVGSTTAMGAWLDANKPRRVALITECSMADNLAVDHPEVEWVKPCNLCPHMKRITLAGIRDALRDMRHEVEVDDDVVAGARRALDRMLAVGRGERVAVATK